MESFPKGPGLHPHILGMRRHACSTGGHLVVPESSYFDGGAPQRSDFAPDIRRFCEFDGLLGFRAKSANVEAMSTELQEFRGDLGHPRANFAISVRRQTLLGGVRRSSGDVGHPWGMSEESERAWPTFAELGHPRDAFGQFRTTCSGPWAIRPILAASEAISADVQSQVSPSKNVRSAAPATST